MSRQSERFRAAARHAREMGPRGGMDPRVHAAMIEGLESDAEAMEARERADQLAELNDSCPTCGSSNPDVLKVLPRPRSRARRLFGLPPVYVACRDRWHDRQGL